MQIEYILSLLFLSIVSIVNILVFRGYVNNTDKRIDALHKDLMDRFMARNLYDLKSAQRIEHTQIEEKSELVEEEIDPLEHPNEYLRTLKMGANL